MPASSSDNGACTLCFLSGVGVLNALQHEQEDTNSCIGATGKQLATGN